MPAHLTDQKVLLLISLKYQPVLHKQDCHIFLMYAANHTMFTLHWTQVLKTQFAVYVSGLRSYTVMV